MNESKSKVLAMSSTTVTGTYSLDNVLVDKAIIGALPPGNKPVNITPHGTSSWATTARVECEFEVQHADGSRGTRRRAYFVKIMPPGTDEGAQRVLAEFISMDEIHRTLPSIAPRPLGYGKCALNPDAHYFVCEFLDIKQDDLPDPVDLGKKLAELHRKSESPTGMFGFTHDTYDGKFPLKTKWDSSWTSFFTKLVLGVYQIDTEVNGLWKELEDALNVTAEKIIPRLLNALTANGRSIKPCLIHGDLWESNIGTDRATGEIYIFDACAYYEHHEKELSIWRCAHHQMYDSRYRNEYFKNFPPSEPVEEADDRSRLYAVETLLMHSAHFPGAATRRKALEEMNWLIEKYREEL